MSSPREYEDVVPRRQRQFAEHLGVKEAVFYAGRRTSSSLPEDPGVVPYTNGNGAGHVGNGETASGDSEPPSADGDLSTSDSG